MDRKGTFLGPMVSRHFDRSADFNESNVGAGYMSPDGYAAGFYQNSYNRPSFYAGREFSMPMTNALRAVLMAGGVTGYPASPVLPFAAPGLVGRMGPHELALMLQPPIGPTKGALALQYRKRF